ncbi:MAG: NAD-dependent epimerase/dehydratase family protein [Candidatus Schekmanbacteria bacterium]|nr:NAD-dependent epimerase/dehydratase family protein [Candidatus Schekmanbacteria bacterium]
MLVLDSYGNKGISPMKCLVTGGAGYIGSNLADRLLGEGHEVTVLDNLYTGRLKNIEHNFSNKKFRFVFGCVLDTELLSTLIRESDIIFHLAAIVGVPYVLRNPVMTLLNNTSGDQKVFQLALDYRKKLIFASSSEVYGCNNETPFSEESSVVLGSSATSRWSYAASKYFAEHLGQALHGRGLDITILRFASCYGPRLNPNGMTSVIAKFIINALNNEPIPIYGKGNQTRPFTYVDDTVSGIISAMKSKNGAGEIFNISTSGSTSIEQAAKLIKNLTGSKSEIIFIEPRELGTGFEDIVKRELDTSKAMDKLVFKADVSLEKGLMHTIEWFKNNQPSPA